MSWRRVTTFQCLMDEYLKLMLLQPPTTEANRGVDLVHVCLSDDFTTTPT